jgi:hypothetical protein
VLTGMGFGSPVCGEREEHVSGRLLKHPNSATDDQVLFLPLHLSPLSMISINIVVNSLAFVSEVITVELLNHSAIKERRTSLVPAISTIY